MSNSSIIRKSKNKLIKEIIKDKDIVKAIDSFDISMNTPEKLINTHIFDYHQNPYTIQKTGTFITIQVHISQPFDNRAKTFVNSEIEIWVISHERHMTVDNIPKITSNRNDYISELLDQKFNGYNGLGLGTLKLRSNVEGAYQSDYLYRKLVFVGVDINDSLCEEV